jgi:hypothetical protein
VVWNNVGCAVVCTVLILLLNCVLSSSFDFQFSLVLGSSWRDGDGAVAFHAARWVQLHHQDRTHQRLQGQEVQPEIQHATAGVRSGLAARRHHVLLPPGSFLGAIQRLFFDMWYARSSAIARRHIGAACWLVLVRLYNLKRPKSQFWSTMGSFSMTGLIATVP